MLDLALNYHRSKYGVPTSSRASPHHSWEDVSLASFLGLLGGSYNAHPTNADAIMNAIGTRMPQPGSV